MQRGCLAVDLERVERFVSARIAGGFEGRERTVPKARQKRAGVVDADRLFFARQIVFAALMNVSVIAVTSSIGPFSHKRRVDVVRQQIARDAAAGNVDIQPPEAFAALRQIGRDGPVLQEHGAVVKDPAQAAFVDQIASPA